MAAGFAATDRNRRFDIALFRLGVRLALGDGTLPPIGPSRAGRGTGTPCAVCGRTIPASRVAYHVRSYAGALPAHVCCYLVWREQSEEALRDATYSPDARIRVEPATRICRQQNFGILYDKG